MITVRYATRAIRDLGNTDKGVVFHSFAHFLSTNYGLDNHSVVRKVDIKNKFKTQRQERPIF